MAVTDPTPEQAAQAVKIIGSDLTGAETFPAAVDSAGNVQTVINNTVPVIRPNSYTSGTISALLGAVTLAVPEGQSSWDVYISGTFSTGSIVQFQGSPDNSQWFNLNGRRSGDVNTNDTTTTLATDVFGGPGPLGGSPSNWRGNLAAVRYFRVVATAFTLGDSIAIQISTSSATGVTFLNAALPSGTNIIGQTYNTSASGNVAAVSGFNRLQVTPEPSDLLSDKFDTLDTTVRWNTASANGASDSVGAGNLNMTGGTTPGAYTSLSSQPVFTQKANVQLSHGVTLKFEAGPIIAGAHRFWGFGTAGANTVASPLTDAVGWEIDNSGILNAVVYGGGTKIYSQALPTPTDGKVHRYSLTWRTDKITFYLDSGDVQSAVASGYIPNVQILPARFHVITGTATTAPWLQVTAIGISDTGRNSAAISDGVYGFRKASVSGNNDLQVRDSINTAISSGAITVSTTVVEAKVGASRLTNRKVIVITPTTGVIYWGSSSGVTSATGTPIFKNQSLTLSFTDAIPVYLIGTAGTDVRIVEGS
jgi:hypothetical protein